MTRVVDLWMPTGGSSPRTSAMPIGCVTRPGSPAQPAGPGGGQRTGRSLVASRPHEHPSVHRARSRTVISASSQRRASEPASPGREASTFARPSHSQREAAPSWLLTWEAATSRSCTCSSVSLVGRPGPGSVFHRRGRGQLAGSSGDRPTSTRAHQREEWVDGPPRSGPARARDGRPCERPQVPPGPACQRRSGRVGAGDRGPAAPRFRFHRTVPFIPASRSSEQRTTRTDPARAGGALDVVHRPARRDRDRAPEVATRPSETTGLWPAGSRSSACAGRVSRLACGSQMDGGGARGRGRKAPWRSRDVPTVPRGTRPRIQPEAGRSSQEGRSGRVDPGAVHRPAGRTGRGESCSCACAVRGRGSAINHLRCRGGWVARPSRRSHEVTPRCPSSGLFGAGRRGGGRGHRVLPDVPKAPVRRHRRASAQPRRGAVASAEMPPAM